MILLFKAFSALLSYPSAEMRAALPEIADVIRTSPLVVAQEREDVLGLLTELAQGDLLEVEERYVDLFDRGKALSLNLFEHLHGEDRDRGTAMVDLKRLYENAGFDLATSELPDYLPVFLEYLSCGDLAGAKEHLADCAHILRAIARSLLARQSRYAAVLQALIVIAGEAPVDAKDVKPMKPPRQELDRDWVEQPAFAGAPDMSASASRARPS
jgi:nitrate reductase delta subunit